ncbi:integrase core domain protein [Lasius niger]|uniref:Integrase core domain protein n=1 Tax=Lasius niger TaxID=67767 RepID=A0A0J7NG47_LASNI|nr:integrase core domain protein [Lasius niger]KMQ95350.1 integrase core domain protein [Lasius niger]
MAVVYVDDIIVMSENPQAVMQFGADLGKRFDMKDIGKLKRCLGMDFVQNRNSIRINQHTYITDLLQRFGMQDCKPVSTPLDVGTKLTKTDPWTAADGQKPPYRELIGGLLIMNGGCISWDSKKQRTVALSSTEAEYMVLSEAAKEAVYFRRLLRELGINAGKVTLSNDNLGAQ